MIKIGGSLLLLALSAMMLYAEEWTGYISDSKCAATQAESADHASCARSCIAKGAAAVLVSQRKVYDLDNQKEAKKFAGEKVLVKGTASDDRTSIKVESIEKAEN